MSKYSDLLIIVFTIIFAIYGNTPGTFWFSRSDVEGKMVQIEEANAGIAIAMARIDDEGRSTPGPNQDNEPNGFGSEWTSLQKLRGLESFFTSLPSLDGSQRQ